MTTNVANLTKALYTATSGMVAQNKRILVISENLANAGTRNSAAGLMPYGRRVPSFKTVFDKKTGASIVVVSKIKKDHTPFTKIYAPHDAAADKNGFVYESNVKSMIEMTDMREASRSHEANLKAFERIMFMLQNSINLLKNN